MAMQKAKGEMRERKGEMRKGKTKGEGAIIYLKMRYRMRKWKLKRGNRHRQTNLHAKAHISIERR